MQTAGNRTLVPVERIELPTFGLQNRCSTAELNRQIRETRRQIPELPGKGYRPEAGNPRAAMTGRKQAAVASDTSDSLIGADAGAATMLWWGPAAELTFR